MSRRIKQALILILVSAFIGLVVNAVSESGIPLKGNWPSVSDSDSVIVPPSAEEGDPPFISLDEAAARFQNKNVLFIDARYPEDFEYGHIRGAVNISYDLLPIENIQAFWDSTAQFIPRDKQIVVYCSGQECESSLFLGRDMADFGWTNILIFYGGWREWERAWLPIEKGEDNQ